MYIQLDKIASDYSCNSRTGFLISSMIPLPNFLEGICKQSRLLWAVTHWAPLGRTEMLLSLHIWFFTPCYATSPGFCKAQSFFQVVWKSPPPSSIFPIKQCRSNSTCQIQQKSYSRKKDFLESFLHSLDFLWRLQETPHGPSLHELVSVGPPTPGTSGFQYNENFFRMGTPHNFSSPQLLPTDIKNLSIGHKCLQKICVYPKQSRSELIITASRGSLYGLLHILNSLHTGQGDIQSFLDMKFIKIA